MGAEARPGHVSRHIHRSVPLHIEIFFSGSGKRKRRPRPQEQAGVKSAVAISALSRDASSVLRTCMAKESHLSSQAIIGKRSTILSHFAKTRIDRDRYYNTQDTLF